MKLQRFTSNNKEVSKNQWSRLTCSYVTLDRIVANLLRVVIARDIFPRFKLVGIGGLGYAVKSMQNTYRNGILVY